MSNVARMSGRSALLAVAAAVLTVSGCAQGVQVDERPDGPTVLSLVRMSDTVRQAEVSGTVAVEGGCFVLVNAASARPWILIWPHGAERSASDSAAVLIGDWRVRAGDRIVGSGGFSEPKGEGPGIAHDCDVPDAAGYAGVDVLIDVAAPQ